LRVLEEQGVAGSRECRPSSSRGRCAKRTIRTSPIVSENPRLAVADLRTKPGKDIWLFGGGSLFRSLLEAQLVDAVEVAVMSVLLGKCIILHLVSHARQGPRDVGVAARQAQRAGRLRSPRRSGG
jgi:hypothetical protein